MEVGTPPPGKNYDRKICVKAPRFGEPVVTELHSFSDASDVGLDQVTYLRLVNNSSQVHVSFLMGKARVAPLKPMSTPRRELTAAVISANVATMLSRELKYKDQLKYFTLTPPSFWVTFVTKQSASIHLSETAYTTSTTDQNPSSGTMLPAPATQLTLPHEAQPPNNFPNTNSGLKVQVSCGRRT